MVSRCLQGFAFLKPTKEIRSTTKGVLGFTLNKYEEVIQLHHYVFLSNHFHLILTAKTSRDLAEFMCFFKGNLARELARIHDWHGTLWQKRYSSEKILEGIYFADSLVGFLGWLSDFRLCCINKNTSNQ